jgi:hypothetical protein
MATSVEDHEKRQQIASNVNLIQNHVSQVVPILPESLHCLPWGNAYVLKYKFSPSFCQEIINHAKDVAWTRGGWRTDRHTNYATTDLCLFENFSEVMKIKILVLLEKIRPLIKNIFGIHPFIGLNMRDIFICKYENLEHVQNSLSHHIDGSILSFVIKLNDSFEGGHTVFEESEVILNNVDVGSITLFSGGLVRHGGMPVTEGTRYILTGFIYFGHEQREFDKFIDLKSQYLKDQVTKHCQNTKNLEMYKLQLKTFLKTIYDQIVVPLTKDVDNNPVFEGTHLIEDT